MHLAASLGLLLGSLHGLLMVHERAAASVSPSFVAPAPLSSGATLTPY